MSNFECNFAKIILKIPLDFFDVLCYRSTLSVVLIIGLKFEPSSSLSNEYYSEGRKKMTDEGKKSGWRKAWEFFQTFGAGAGIIALQHAIEEALTGAGKKAGEKAGAKISEWFGLEADYSGKGQVDNAIVDKVVSLLEVLQRKDFRDFCLYLFEKDPKKFKQFTGRIAILADLDAEKKTVKSEPKKDKPGPTVITESTKRDYGTPKAFIEELMSYPNNDERMKFLEGAGVFEKNEEEKPGITFIKGTITKARGAEEANRQDFNSTMANWLKRSEAWRNSK